MVIALFLIFLLSAGPTQALERLSSVTIQASISDNSITIFGYTAPGCKVEMTSTDTYATVFSAADGFFEFKNTYLPKTYTDLCFASKDDLGRPTVPVCIPPPPATQYHNDIGPIILPPTIAVDADTISPNSTSESSGQTLPNAPVKIYLYQNDQNAPVFARPASALSLPVFTTQSDQNGYFSFSLPTAYASNFRLFASTEFESTPSPKSNTIQYNLPSIWYLYWLQYRFLILLLPLFIASLAFLIYLIILNRQKRPHYLPVIYPKTLALYPLSSYISPSPKLTAAA